MGGEEIALQLVRVQTRGKKPPDHVLIGHEMTWKKPELVLSGQELVSARCTHAPALEHSYRSHLAPAPPHAPRWDVFVILRNYGSYPLN